MKLPSVRLWFQAARRHVQDNDRYRWWPLYAAGLAGFAHVAFYSPFETATVSVLWERPWTAAFIDTAFQCAVALSACLGLVGLLRSSWVARGLSLYALWFGYHYLTTTGIVLQQLWAEFTWYTVGIAGSFIDAAVGEGTLPAAILWCIYVAAVWMAIRPLVKRVYPKLGWLEGWLVKQGSHAMRLVRSVI